MELSKLVSLAIFGICLQISTTCTQDLPEAQIDLLSTMTVGQQIQYFGYVFENHVVTTADNYILTLHRMPSGKTLTPESLNARPAILLQHGFLSFSGDWLLTGPSALGYRLADEGYDVWLLNSRGNSYSNRHVFLDRATQPAAFYNYSFHDLGTGDLSACIDYILTIKNVPDLGYVGHSQGTSAFYALMAERPEYNSKVRVQYSLAPIAYFRNVRTLLYIVGALFRQLLEFIFPILNIYHLGRDQLAFRLVDEYCVSTNLTRDQCIQGIFSQIGYNPLNLQPYLLRLFLANSPVPSSTKELFHYLQLYSTEDYIFRQFDYGPSGNLALYNSSVPPSYNLSNIVCPVRLVYSCNDFLSDCRDVIYLDSQLPNSTLYLVPDEDFNHLDYVWGRNSSANVAGYIVPDLATFF